MGLQFKEEELFACCESTKFAKEMAKASPFSSLDEAVTAAREIWFNQVDVNAWLQAFSAHPQIGHSSSSSNATSAQWSKGEQATAFATATNSSLQELSEWNAKYRQKFGFVFLICASGKSTDGILTELKKRYPNRPIAEFEIAAQEQMKITELRLAKLFSTKENVTSTCNKNPTLAKKVEVLGFAHHSIRIKSRVGVIGAHLSAASDASSVKKSQAPPRTRPPITTHVLDVSRGSPGAGIEVCLEMWKGPQPRPMFGESDAGGWVFQGSSTTDNDGRSGQLMSIVDAVNPGIYRINFNTESHRNGNIFMFPAAVTFLIHNVPWKLGLCVVQLKNELSSKDSFVDVN
ncbi:uric acid degradation bifunctional protein TTL isoform X1 [Prunus yedoensis var. nudiflora]|uniref:2-oxo-4-hydroxy-4-carboxy-5-ureidoimidazoline decarboxylase n=1 Tax=Prunus yedoensis var. nudiflora TaxID=2094558 RepID=A0A314YYP5_PRUYE|nr:uric acid degradation bifunctional protein TTL isoform X1 [Prunus yedoensis var. nudiflora]